MKWLKRIVVAVVLLIIVGLTILYFSLNSIIKTTVEKQATASLNTQTTLGSAHLAIFGGSLSLNDLEIASPPKYDAPHMFTLGGATVHVSYGQLSGNPIHISQISIDNPVLVIENDEGKLNLQAMMNQIPSTPTDSSGASKPPMKLIIDELDLTNAHVTFLPGLPGLPSQIDVPIPSLTMKNIGNADGAGNGAAVKDVVMQVTTALAGQASKDGKLPIDLNSFLTAGLGDVSQKLGGEVSKQIQDVTGNLTGNLTKNLPGGVGNIVGGATSQISGQATDQLQQGLGNLLGGKKPAPTTKP
jgi:uncharacterized protein involved in outer membrane biogenesis